MCSGATSFRGGVAARGTHIIVGLTLKSLELLRSGLIMLEVLGATYTTGLWPVVLPQLSSAFFRLFCGFFVTENAVIDVTVQEMVTNIATLHTFQIKKKLSKYMQPILKYSKNNMWFF
jgi:hypothetical protein